MWRKLPDFRAEKKVQNPVTSVAVMVFSVPIFSNYLGDFRVALQLHFPWVSSTVQLQEIILLRISQEFAAITVT